MLANDDQLEFGQDYTFHFSYGGLQSGARVGSIISAVTADSNFIQVSAATKSLGVVSSNDLAVHFTYNGNGSIVGDAAAEMLKVISDSFFGLDIGVAIKFESASLGNVQPGTDTPRKPGDTELAGDLPSTGSIGLIFVALAAFAIFLLITEKEIF